MRTPLAERAKTACEHVKPEGKFSRSTSTINYRRWRYLQMTVIIASCIGMIVGPLPMSEGYESYAWVRSLPAAAAAAALAAAVLAGLNFQKGSIA